MRKYGKMQRKIRQMICATVIAAIGMTAFPVVDVHAQTTAEETATMTDAEAENGYETTDNATCDSEVGDTQTAESGENVLEDVQNSESDEVSLDVSEENEELMGAIVPDVTYSIHMQTYGDRGPYTNGDVAGSTYENKRMEAIWITLGESKYTGGIRYKTHVQSYGWESDWRYDGAKSGTSGQAKRLEALQIELYGEIAEHYDVYYCVYSETYGWLDWAKNGQLAGTAGQSKKLEAFRVRLYPKDQEFYGDTSCAYIEVGKNASGRTGLVNYKTHVQTYGDQTTVCDGSVSGTFGESKRLEAIYISLGDTGYSGGIEYRTHIQTYGWEDDSKWKRDGEQSGTSGQSKRLEAIQIRLYGEVADNYDVYYRVHCQNFGWLGWAMNGSSAGTAGFSKRLEGIQIVLVPKDSYSNMIYYSESGNSAFINANDMANLGYYERESVCTFGHGYDNVDKATAESWQTTITVPCWDYTNSYSLTKVTKYRTLKLNKAIATQVSNAFNEIYNSAEHPVIDGSLYSFSYRQNVNNTSRLSSHGYGLAIDINPGYNPNGTAALTYAEWTAMPENSIQNIQSKGKKIYAGCTIEKVMKKYGFTWIRSYDPMHFDFKDISYSGEW